MAFNTRIVNDWLAQRRQTLEQERQATLAKMLLRLEHDDDRHEIHQACLFGSIIRPGNFAETSDVDIVVRR